jgi:hypothetical protein
MFNQLVRLVELFPDWDWDWGSGGLSSNPALSWRLLEKFPDKDWDWGDLSENPALNWSVIRAHPEKPWDYEQVLSNPSLSFSELQECLRILDSEDFDPGVPVSEHWNISFQDILENPEFNWNERFLETNPSISLRELLELSQGEPGRPFSGWNWNYQNLSKNSRLDLSLLTEFPEKPWDLAEISLRNQRLTPEFVLSRARELNFQKLSWNSVITAEIFLSTREKNWNLRALLFSTRDPALARVLLSDTDLQLPCSEEFFSEHFSLSSQLDFRLLAEIQSFNVHGDEGSFWDENWDREGFIYLDTEELLSRDPETYDMGSLSSNPFYKDPIRIVEFLCNSLRFFRVLLLGLRSSKFHFEFQLVLLPLRLRREDLELRGCPNHSPRLLV